MEELKNRLKDIPKDQLDNLVESLKLEDAMRKLLPESVIEGIMAHGIEPSIKLEYKQHMSEFIKAIIKNDSRRVRAYGTMALNIILEMWSDVEVYGPTLDRLESKVDKNWNTTTLHETVEKMSSAPYTHSALERSLYKVVDNNTIVEAYIDYATPLINAEKLSISHRLEADLYREATRFNYENGVLTLHQEIAEENIDHFINFDTEFMMDGCRQMLYCATIFNSVNHTVGMTPTRIYAEDIHHRCGDN